MTGSEDFVQLADGGTRKLKESWMKELTGLNKAGVLHFVKKSRVPKCSGPHGTCFVDLVKKQVGSPDILKSRLIAQNYREDNATEIPSRSPIISKFGQILALCLPSKQPGHDAYTRHIIQEYTQGRSKLERPVYLKPPSEMSLPPGSVLLAMKTLYGIKESALHCFIT